MGGYSEILKASIDEQASGMYELKIDKDTKIVGTAKQLIEFLITKV